MQWMYHVIGQAGIFLICAQTLVHFRPKESYEKYLKLLLSVMLLLQLLQPVLTFLGSDGGQNVTKETIEFSTELQTVLEQASKQAEGSEERIQDAADGLTENAGKLQETAETSEESGEIVTESGEDRVTSEAEKIQIEIAPIELE